MWLGLGTVDQFGQVKTSLDWETLMKCHYCVSGAGCVHNKYVVNPNQSVETLTLSSNIRGHVPKANGCWCDKTEVKGIKECPVLPNGEQKSSRTKEYSQNPKGSNKSQNTRLKPTRGRKIIFGPFWLPKDRLGERKIVSSLTFFQQCVLFLPSWWLSPCCSPRRSLTLLPWGRPHPPRQKAWEGYQ